MSSLAYAQNLQNANWLFGKYAGLNFNPSPPPAPLSPPSTGMDTPEGCATISYPDGSLMFYTNSNKVWNKNHQLMPNGTGLIGSAEGSQNAVIIPRPGDNTRFFIVTLDGYLGGKKGLYYSEVDMTLNGGLGDVITSNKNTVLRDHYGTPIDPGYGNLSHRITYYPHANGQDYWLVTQIDKFVFSHLVTNTGIVSVAVNGAAAPWIANYPPGATGQMKISPNGKKIAMAYTSSTTGTGAVFLGNFDPSTGGVSISSTPVSPPSIWGHFWGLEFSPNSQVLYYTAETSVYAYEIVDRKTDRVGEFTDPDVSMQLAIDGRIYIATREINKISHIKFPNTFGAGCAYEYAAVSLGSRISHRGLPGWVYWQNQKLWPRTFSSSFVRAEPKYIETDVNGNVYYFGSIHNESFPINTRSHEDSSFIIPYWDEHLQPGFNPANYSQPQMSLSQLIKFDKDGNTIWHKPLGYVWDQTHIRKTTDRIFIYRDGNAFDPDTKEVISLNNTTITAQFSHSWGQYNGIDQNGYEIYVKRIGTNSFAVSFVNPNTNAVMSTTSVSTSGTMLHDTPWLKIAYIAGADYIFMGEYLYSCPVSPCPVLNTIKVVHAKKIGSAFNMASSILYQYDNDYFSYKELHHLYFNNKLFLGYFNENIYETFVSPTTPINATIEVFNYSPGTFTPTAITITTPGDYLYSMSVVNNKVLYVGHKRLYEGVASSNYSPMGIVTFPSDAAGAIATYDNLGNIIVAGKYWQPSTLTMPGATQNLLAYGGGYVYPANPYVYTEKSSGHHFVTKFKPVSGGYNFYRPAVGSNEKVKDTELTDEVTLYPNPVIREFTIQSAKEFNAYEIWSVEGKLISKGELSTDGYRVDVSGFAKGNYFIKLFDKDGKEESRQFLKL